MNTQLYVETQTVGQWVQLDLLESDPIKITISSEDLEDPTQIPSTFSKEFRIPDTPVNNEFFKNAFLVNSTDFDATKKSNAYILVNGNAIDAESLVYGNIRLTNIYTNESTSLVEYEIVFMGNVSNFSSSIANGYLSDLDLSDFDHELTMSNIEASWDRNLLRGAIVYPFIEWGYTYSPGPTGTKGDYPEQIQFSANPYNSFSMLQTSVPPDFPVKSPGLTRWHFKPSIQIKTLLDKIFSSAGYTYTSNFIDTPFFKNLYFVGDSEARWTLRDELTINVQVGSVKSYQIRNSSFTSAPLKFTEIVYDQSNMTPNFYSFENGGTYFQFPVSDTYDVTLNFEFITPYSNLDRTIYSTSTIYVKKISGGITSTLYSTSATANFASNYIGKFSITYSGSFLKGDQIYYEWEWNSGNKAVKPDPGVLNMTVYADSLQVRPNMILPKDITKVDFIKSIFNRFKMVMLANPNKSNDFLIEPYNYWITQGQSKDWTDKVDWSKEISYSPLFYTQKREYVFVDREDSDFPNQQFKSENNRIFGQLNINSGNQLIVDKTEIDSIFAPTPVNLVFGTTGGFIIPNIYQSDIITRNIFQSVTDSPKTPIAPKPRLLYFEGKRPTGVTYYVINDLNNLEAKVYYPKFTYLAPTSQGLFDLNWKNEPPYWRRWKLGGSGQLDPSEGRTQLTAYTIYWQSWLEDMWNGFSRKMKCQVKLTYEDIKSLGLNDRIWIKDAYWRILTISDFPIGDDSIVECEFIKSPTIKSYALLQAEKTTEIKIEIKQE